MKSDKTKKNEQEIRQKNRIEIRQKNRRKKSGMK